MEKDNDVYIGIWFYRIEFLYNGICVIIAESIL